MIDVNKITSTLAKLSDLQLQTYAKMNPDPYTIALAVAESNRRKEMRSAGQGMQGMQPQPKVVDQAVAAMVEQPAQQPAQPMPSMPEEQGIGGLPAAQQMNFADGGITGYADGGQVERYQSQGLVQPYETPYDRMNRQNREAKQRSAQERVPQAMAVTESNVQALNSSAQDRVNELMQNREDLVRRFGPNMYDQALARARAQAESAGQRGSELIAQQSQMGQERMAAAAPTPPFGSNFAPVNPADVAGSPVPATPVASGAPAPAGQAPAAAPRPTASRPGAPVSAAPPSAAKVPAQSIEDRFLSAQQKMTDQPNPFAIQQREIADTEETLARDRAAGVASRQDQFKDAFKGRETRLEDRAKALEKSKDTNTGLAFLEAGLAIMSTPGGLATAIGKGAREGTAKYASGIEKLRSAKDKLDEAKDRMEELKLNRDEMSAKERAEAELGIQQTVLSGKKDALSSAKTLYGERSTLSQKIVESTLGIEEKAKDRANATQNAGIAQSIAQKPQADFIADWLKKPENAGKTFSDAYIAFRAAGAPATAGRGVMTRDQASDNVAKALEPGIDRKRTIEDATSALAAMGNAKPTLAEIKEHLIQEQMRGAGVAGSVAGATTPSSGKVPPPPSGYRLN